MAKRSAKKQLNQASLDRSSDDEDGRNEEEIEETPQDDLSARVYYCTLFLTSNHFTLVFPNRNSVLVNMEVQLLQKLKMY
jgi:hypothetical protein